MSIGDIIDERGIEEIVHFTTNHGCLGTLYTGFLQSRQRLQNDPMVEYLFAPNASLRKDVAYLDHVSLSIGHINTQFFQTSAGAWHRDEPIFWCVLAFSPLILTHPHVEFATTNNIYTGVRRAEGEEGLRALYADPVVQWHGRVVRRDAAMPAQYPTCFQAEALYPGAVSTEYLERIYVRSQSDQSEVIGFLKATLHRDIDVIVDAEKFGSRPR